MTVSTPIRYYSSNNFHVLKIGIMLFVILGLLFFYPQEWYLLLGLPILIFLFRHSLQEIFTKDYIELSETTVSLFFRLKTQTISLAEINGLQKILVGHHSKRIYLGLYQGVSRELERHYWDINEIPRTFKLLIPLFIFPPETQHSVIEYIKKARTRASNTPL